MDTRYLTLSLAIHRFAEAYRVELSHSDPESQAQLAPVRGVTALDGGELLATQADPVRYGETLARQLFVDEAVAGRFLEVEAAALASGGLLRRALVGLERALEQRVEVGGHVDGCAELGEDAMRASASSRPSRGRRFAGGSSSGGSQARCCSIRSCSSCAWYAWITL